MAFWEDRAGGQKLQSQSLGLSCCPLSVPPPPLRLQLSGSQGAHGLSSPQTLKVPGTGVASCIEPYTPTLKSQALEPALVQIPALQLTSCVTLSVFLNLSVPTVLLKSFTSFRDLFKCHLLSKAWTIYKNTPHHQPSASPKPCFIPFPTSQVHLLTHF